MRLVKTVVTVPVTTAMLATTAVSRLAKTVALRLVKTVVTVPVMTVTLVATVVTAVMLPAKTVALRLVKTVVTVPVTTVATVPHRATVSVAHRATVSRVKTVPVSVDPYREAAVVTTAAKTALVAIPTSTPRRTTVHASLPSKTSFWNASKPRLSPQTRP